MVVHMFTNVSMVPGVTTHKFLTFGKGKGKVDLYSA